MASVTAQLSAFLQCGASSHLIEQYLKERERERERKKKKKRQRTTSVGQHLSLSLSSSYKGVFGLRWPRPLSAAGSDRSCPTPRPLMDGRPAGHLRSVRPPFVSVRWGAHVFLSLSLSLSLFHFPYFSKPPFAAVCLSSTSKYLSIAIWTVYFFSFLLDSHWGTLIEFCFSGSFDDAFIHFFFFIQWFPTFFFCGGEGGSLPQTAPLKSTEDPPTFVSFFIYYFPRANNVDIATSSFPEKRQFENVFFFCSNPFYPPPSTGPYQPRG